MRGVNADRVATAFRSVLSAISKRNIVWGDWLAPTFILMMPFVAFLVFRGYGLFHAESLLAMAILVGLGLTGSLLIALGQHLRLPFLRRPLFVRPLVYAVFLSLFLDSQRVGKDFVVLVMSYIFGDGAWFVLSVAIFFSVIFVLFYTFSSAFKQKAGTLFSTIFIVALGATVLLPRPFDTLNTITKSSFTIPGETPRLDLPPIIHIVLDEHIGIEGIPGDIPGGAALRAELKEFYLRNGFRLYGRAFSPYFRTANSLANLVNGVVQPYDLSFLSPASDSPYIVSENAWFDRLFDQGYLIKVYQSEHLNFCAGKYSNVADCTTSSVSGLEAIRYTNLQRTAKTGLLLGSFSYHMFIVTLAQKIQNYTQKLLQIDETPSETAAIFRNPGSAASLWAKVTAEGLIDDLREAKPGEAYFAHLLIPHVGFIMDENCRAKPNILTWYNHIDTNLKYEKRLSGDTRPQGYVDRYVEYFKQVRCARRLLSEMLRSLSESGVMDEATIIVHGDHGSRISGMVPLQKYASLLTERDLIDNFSTLFAIRYPGVTAGYDLRGDTVQALFAEQVFGRPREYGPARVFLAEEEKSKRNPEVPLVEYPFPDFKGRGDD